MTPNAGGTVRNEYSGLELQRSAELSAAASAAHCEAMVKARVVLAMQRPRDFDKARQKVLTACKRPGFAEVAIYAKPVGNKKIEGASVRLAETLAQAWRNIITDYTIVYDDQFIRKVHVVAMDVEENNTAGGELIIEKTVERSDPRGRAVLSERTNVSGGKTFLIAATEDELKNKMNAEISKMKRNSTLALIDNDLVQEAMAVCKATMKDADAKNPDEAKRRVLDAFDEIGVSVDDVREYLGRNNLDSLTPAELADLRKAYAAIDSGESTWGQLVEMRDGQRKAKVTAPPPPAAPAASGSTAPAATPPPAPTSTTTATPPASETKPPEGAPVEPTPPAPAPAPAAAPPTPSSATVDEGTKIADDLMAEMRTAANAGDGGKLLKLASGASKDQRIPQTKRNEISALLGELRAVAGKAAAEKKGSN